MPATEHAALGASGAYRWMKCPGSIRLSEGIEDTTSEYAIRGTAAHEVAERCLRDGVDPTDYPYETVMVESDGEEHSVEFTQELADAVQVYVDHVRELADGRLPISVEVRFSLDKLNPPAPMFGTADAVIHDPKTDTLYVRDYKNGRGVVVEPEGNPQLLYYALGAILHLGVRVENIDVGIVQPRASHPDGPIRSHVYSWAELVGFKEALMDAAHEASQPDAPVGPVGDHCRFCPASAICPAQQENALAVAQTEFTALAEEEEPEFQPPETLSDERLLMAMDMGPHVENWLKSVRSYVQSRLERGEEIPGWKLVEKRARRYWRDEDKAREWMEEHGIDPDRAKTRSPYQAEQAAKKLDDVDVPEDLWEKRSSGLNLAREDNPKPGVLPADLAADEFDVEG